MTRLNEQKKTAQLISLFFVAFFDKQSFPTELNHWKIGPFSGHLIHNLTEMRFLNKFSVVNSVRAQKLQQADDDKNFWKKEPRPKRERNEIRVSCIFIASGAYTSSGRVHLHCY